MSSASGRAAPRSAVATDSRIERVEAEVSDRRARRPESIAASGASSRGAWVNSCPGRSSAKPSIQFTEEISVSTCQKQASDADDEDQEDEDLQVRRGEEDLLRRSGRSAPPDAAVSPSTISIVTICRTGWENCGSVL